MVVIAMSGSDALEPGYALWELAIGRLTEASGGVRGGGLTLASSFLSYAQNKGLYSLWLSSRQKPFYPPDLVAAGIRLEKLPLLFLERWQEAAWAMVSLLGSNGFDLLVWDLASWPEVASHVPSAILGKMNAMARRNRTVVLILTDKSSVEPSIDSLIGLRLEVEACSERPSRLRIKVLKDKRGAIGEGRSWCWDCQLPECMELPLKAG